MKLVLRSKSKCRIYDSFLCVQLGTEEGEKGLVRVHQKLDHIRGVKDQNRPGLVKEKEVKDICEIYFKDILLNKEYANEVNYDLEPNEKMNKDISRKKVKITLTKIRKIKHQDQMLCL